jgi:hypothetical protein
MSPGLRKLLELVRQLPDEPLHRHLVEEQLGPNLLAVLTREGVFQDAGQSDRYPCPYTDEGCPRVVVRGKAGSRGKPHWAACGNQVGCASIQVSDADLQVVSFSADRWWALLQAMLDLPEQRAQPDPTIEKAWHLGVQAGRGLSREVVALWRYPSRHLAIELGLLRERHGHALAVLPLTEGVPPELIETHRPGAEVELAFLEHRLRFDDGHLWWRGPEPDGSPRPSAEVRRDTYCLAFDGERHELTRSGYQKEVEGAKNQDLFIDITDTDGQGCRVGRRDLDGQFQWVKPAPNEAQALARLILSGRGLRAAQVRQGMGDHVRYMNRARKKVDVRVGRHGWRFFKAVGSKDEKEFEFNPDPQYRFLLLCRPEFAR